MYTISGLVSTALNSVILIEMPMQALRLARNLGCKFSRSKIRDVSLILLLSAIEVYRLAL